jgi:hypothetical protein
MSEFESSGAGREFENVSTTSQPDAPPQESAADAATATERDSPPSPSRDLTVVAEAPQAQSAPEPRAAPAHRLFPSRFHFAAAAALGVVVAVAGALLVEDRLQARALAEQASENESLVHTIKSLKVRLDAIDTAMSNAGLTDLRQSVGEIRSNLVSTREFSGALAQLSQRVDKLDREASAKVDKLSERVDHEASALTTGLSTRIDKLEQKIVAPASAVAPQAAPPKQPPPRPKLDNVSMDRTSSIERPKPLLRGYVVLDARNDIALVSGRYGEREVRQGDFLPGAGRVERIELRGGGWVVLTSEGLIASADFPRF